MQGKKTEANVSVFALSAVERVMTRAVGAKIVPVQGSVLVSNKLRVSADGLAYRRCTTWQPISMCP